MREGRGNGRRRGSEKLEKLEEVECLKGAACFSRFLFDYYWDSEAADLWCLQ